MPDSLSVSPPALFCVALLAFAAAAFSQGPPSMPPHPAASCAHTNALAAETTSPYLLQHAHNPVRWRPWGKAAFAEARDRDVPILLSIGYATCYWCHVMERESFEDTAIAAQMNEQFVCIKVDREQRPSVDDTYMAAVLALNGHGGWPLTVFLTPPGARGGSDPGLEPIWGATYFPPKPQGTHPGLPQVLDAMSTAWSDDRKTALSQASELTAAVRAQLSTGGPPVQLPPHLIAQAFDGLLRQTDPSHGGFGDSRHGPKFPQAPQLALLLDGLSHASNDKARVRTESILRLTLDKMAQGGIYDHLAGGFHRYSVDAHWTVPHFEKMLYDNGLLASLYARAAGAFDDGYYADIARGICDYALGEMLGADGLFSSGQDAEVDGREGANYLWTRASVQEALQGTGLDGFADKAYGLNGGANFQDPHHPDAPAQSVLRTYGRPATEARRLGVSVEAYTSHLAASRAALLAVRAARVQPRTDDKRLAGWNGLMLAGLADTAAQTKDSRYLDAARWTAQSLLGRMRTSDGGLVRVVRAGKSAAVPGALEDYAYVVRGLVSLDAAERAVDGSSDGWALSMAADLAERAHDRFAAPASEPDETGTVFGGYFDTESGLCGQLVRPLNASEGPTPNPAATLAFSLLQLAIRTGDDAHLDRAGAVLASQSRRIASGPERSPTAVRLLLAFFDADPKTPTPLLASYGVGPGAPAYAAPAPPAPPVQIYTSVSEVTVPDAGAAEVSIKLEIDPGHHVNAHAWRSHKTSDDLELTGLSVNVTGGTGVAAEVQYPQGEVYPFASGEVIFAHPPGEVVLRVLLTRTAEAWAGEPRVSLTFQACTETYCLSPVTVELATKLGPANLGPTNLGPAK